MVHFALHPHKLSERRMYYSGNPAPKLIPMKHTDVLLGHLSWWTVLSSAGHTGMPQWGPRLGLSALISNPSLAP